MKIEIKKKCMHPNGKTELVKGDTIELFNPLARKYVKAGLAVIVPRNTEDWDIIEELGKQVRKPAKKKKEEETGEGRD